MANFLRRLGGNISNNCLVGVDDMEAHDIHAKVRAVYGWDLADLRDGNLLEIFNRLRDQRRRDELV